ncbi:MAG: hypothetical protein IBJ18_01785 [Phycisphaerales bacterium]|nr:hypothetical protein [Phycisphaerales bacterium]
MSTSRFSSSYASLLVVVAGSLSTALGLHAQTATRIADINTSLNPIGNNSNPSKFVSMGSYTLFQASDPAHGTELWRSDGTTAGTVMLKDINPGPVGSNPAEFTIVGTKAYFIANNGDGADLWVTDGTSAGTQRVKAITGAVEGTAAPERWWICNVNGTIFFVAGTNETGAELWKSDGTSAGTVLVKDILPGSFGSNIKNLRAVGDKLFFSASDTGLGNELWVSDGTEAGTVQVKDINPGDLGGEPQNLAAYNGKLYFAADDGVTGNELWVSDGTAAGTQRLANIRTGIDSSNPKLFTQFQGWLYFVVDSPAANAQSMYRTNGTLVQPAAGYDWGQQVTRFSEIVTTPTTMYFAAYTTSEGEELFRLKSTGLGAEIAANIIVGLAGSVPRYITPVGETLYFSANDLARGFELYKFQNGSAVLLKDINAVGGGSSYPKEITPLSNGKVLFSAFDGVNGIELWASDGSTAGSVLVKDINTGNGDSYPTNLTNLNGKLIFSADNGLGQFLQGREPYVSTGTSASTQRLKDINPDEASGMGTGDFFVVAQTRAYFPATTVANGRELWTTDGTPAGTVLPRDIGATTSSGMTAAQNYATVGDIVYFPATDTLGGTELWRSDGTNAGTFRVRDINPGSTSSMGVLGNFSVASVGSTVYFGANTSTNGVELYKTDGTSAGTSRITDIAPGTASSNPLQFTAFNNTLYFTATNTAFGRELYRINPVGGAAQLVKDIGPGGLDGIVAATTAAPGPVVSNGKLYFVADDSVNGPELWVSDGNPANPGGTFMLADINPGLSGSRISRITAGPNGQTFFAADNGANGRELWVTDGTDRGTRLVRDINPGAEGSITSSRWVIFNNRLYFAADDGSFGVELWTSDGTEGGTVRVTDINPGRGSSNVTELRVSGDKLYFTATDGFTGQELYVLSGRCSPADIATSAGTPGSDGIVNEGDFNAFFAADGFFFQAAQGPAAIGSFIDIADDSGNVPPGPENSGVNEGDYNAFFNTFFLGC